MDSDPNDGPAATGAAEGNETTVRAVHRGLLRAFARTAAPPGVSELARDLQRPVATIEDALRTLEEEGHILRKDGAIETAYPFSATPTGHRVVTPDGPAVHVMCAIDALGVHFMLGLDLRVEASCPHCDAPVVVEMRGGRARSTPEDVLVWYPRVDAAPVPARDLCPLVNFFPSQEHLDAWLVAHGTPDGETLSLETAAQAGKVVFGELLSE
jgi:hypothetical protein